MCDWVLESTNKEHSHNHRQFYWTACFRILHWVLLLIWLVKSTILLFVFYLYKCSFFSFLIFFCLFWVNWTFFLILFYPLCWFTSKNSLFCLCVHSTHVSLIIIYLQRLYHFTYHIRILEQSISFPLLGLCTIIFIPFTSMYVLTPKIHCYYLCFRQ